ncbi:MAG: ATP-binding protein, partial [Candidatus Omnitrophica bacterium]|nr:ATP-binding protein [Candidatus Omnitrophota bacterium]
TLAAQKKISLSAALPEQPLCVNGNKVHLSRLFFNLIQNALKFTPEGGSVELSVCAEGEKITISISDTGAGISEEDLPRLFQRFFHKASSQPESAEGVGLGLSIARSIAVFHGGDITVKSRPGEGSTFTVILPGCNA